MGQMLDDFMRLIKAIIHDPVIGVELLDHKNVISIIRISLPFTMNLTTLRYGFSYDEFYHLPDIVSKGFDCIENLFYFIFESPILHAHFQYTLSTSYHASQSLFFKKNDERRHLLGIHRDRGWIIAEYNLMFSIVLSDRTNHLRLALHLSSSRLLRVSICCHWLYWTLLPILSNRSNDHGRAAAKLFIFK